MTATHTQGPDKVLETAQHKCKAAIDREQVAFTANLHRHWIAASAPLVTVLVTSLIPPPGCVTLPHLPSVAALLIIAAPALLPLACR